MRARLIKSSLILIMFIATFSIGYSAYQIREDDPSTTVSNIDQGQTEEKLHRVTFNNRVTGESISRYYEDGYYLSMADLADLSSTPEEMYLSEGSYLTWSVTSEGDEKGQKLSDHIQVASDLTLDGTLTSYATTDNIRLNYSTNDPSADRSYDAATTSTLQSVYNESLNVGKEYVGTPDNMIYLDREAYSSDVELRLMIVRAEHNGFLGLGKSFKNGYYGNSNGEEDTHVEQTNYDDQAIGQSINIRLNSSGGDENGFGKEDSSGKFISYNADSTIGLANTEGSNTPYKSSTGISYTCENPDSPNSTNCSTNYCANRIILENDVIFTGSITVGGITGYYGTNIDFSQSGFQGYINGSYCEIDLNGYDLILTDGSQLLSYGSITDSSRFDGMTYSNEGDTGSLVLLPGSSLQSPFVYEDIFLPLSTPTSYYSNSAPSDFYRCPYLDCKTIFYAGSHFSGEYKVDLAGITSTSNPTLGTSGIVNFIGTEGDANNLLLLYSGKIIRDVSYSSDSVYASRASDLFNQQINYTIQGAELHFANWLMKFSMDSLISVSAEFNSSKYQFFIPFYYRVNIVDSTVYLNQELVFMTGSYLNVDSGSKLILSYSDVLHQDKASNLPAEDYQSVGGLTFLDAFYYSQVSTSYYSLYDAKNTDLLSNGSNRNLWEALDSTPAYCNFDGELEIRENEGVTQYHSFRFGGEMDISHMSSFQRTIDEWNSDSNHRKVELFGNYFMLGPNSADSKTSPDINRIYVRGFYTPPLMTTERKVLVDVTTKDHVARSTNIDSSAGTSFIDGTPTMEYNSDTGVITDSLTGSTYAFIPDYSWSANWDNDSTTNFYGSTTLVTTDRNPDDLAGSFWPVTVSEGGRYVTVSGEDLGSGSDSSDLTFDRPINIFYRGSFVYVNGSMDEANNTCTTPLYRYAGGKNDSARSSTYKLSYSSTGWSISGVA